MAHVHVDTYLWSKNQGLWPSGDIDQIPNNKKSNLGNWNRSWIVLWNWEERSDDGWFEGRRRSRWSVMGVVRCLRHIPGGQVSRPRAPMATDLQLYTMLTPLVHSTIDYKSIAREPPRRSFRNATLPHNCPRVRSLMYKMHYAQCTYNPMPAFIWLTVQLYCSYAQGGNGRSLHASYVCRFQMGSTLMYSCNKKQSCLNDV